MKTFAVSFITICCVMVTACGGGSDHQDAPPINYTPELRAFDMLDSYDVDTAFSSAPLSLNPYLYHGLFEVYWEVRSREDYRASVRINDVPDIIGSQLVHSEICGPGLWCDQAGSLMCDYGADLTMSCSTSGGRTSIDYLFRTIPDQLYMILQICDLNSPYCEYSYYPVWME